MKANTWVDPIVEEVRSWREKIFREAGYDLERLTARLKESQERHGERLVRKVETSDGPSSR
jgi:hypothetical protein